MPKIEEQPEITSHEEQGPKKVSRRAVNTGLGASALVASTGGIAEAASGPELQEAVSFVEQIKKEVSVFSSYVKLYAPAHRRGERPDGFKEYGAIVVSMQESLSRLEKIISQKNLKAFQKEQQVYLTQYTKAYAYIREHFGEEPLQDVVTATLEESEYDVQAHARTEPDDIRSHVQPRKKPKPPSRIEMWLSNLLGK